MELQTWAFRLQHVRDSLNLGGDRAGARRRRGAGHPCLRIWESIMQCLNAGLIDEFAVALAPAPFGKSVRLFEGMDANRVASE